MTSKRVEPRPPYPPLPAWTWPEPGVRTWTPRAVSLFGSCTGGAACDSGDRCPVGVRTTGSGVYGCDCLCHAAKRARLATGP